MDDLNYEQTLENPVESSPRLVVVTQGSLHAIQDFLLTLHH